MFGSSESSSTTPRRKPADPPTPSAWQTLLDACARPEPSNPLLVGAATAGLLLASNRIWHRYGRRIRNVDELAPTDFAPRRLRGVVTSVGDADNFRLYHRPALRPWSRPPTKRPDLKGETLHPYSQEALELTATVMGKRLLVELHQKDQYGRVVGMAYVRVFPWLRRRNVSAMMLEAGFATVYESAGAVHAGQLDRFRALEANAKSKRKGMWVQSARAYESPAAYKQRFRSP
ncbi:TNase-like domain-containing protein [Rhodotorula toruloides]|nr:TNase-like domain-containing protein [Rhodotorula toruloides]